MCLCCSDPGHDCQNDINKRFQVANPDLLCKKVVSNHPTTCPLIHHLRSPDQLPFCRPELPRHTSHRLSCPNLPLSLQYGRDAKNPPGVANLSAGSEAPEARDVHDRGHNVCAYNRTIPPSDPPPGA